MILINFTGPYLSAFLVPLCVDVFVGHTEQKNSKSIKCYLMVASHTYRAKYVNATAHLPLVTFTVSINSKAHRKLSTFITKN